MKKVKYSVFKILSSESQFIVLKLSSVESKIWPIRNANKLRFATVQSTSKFVKYAAVCLYEYQ